MPGGGREVHVDCVGTLLQHRGHQDAAAQHPLSGQRPAVANVSGARQHGSSLLKKVRAVHLAVVAASKLWYMHAASGSPKLDMADWSIFDSAADISRSAINTMM